MDSAKIEKVKEVKEALESMEKGFVTPLNSEINLVLGVILLQQQILGNALLLILESINFSRKELNFPEKM